MSADVIVGELVEEIGGVRSLESVGEEEGLSVGKTLGDPVALSVGGRVSPKVTVGAVVEAIGGDLSSESVGEEEGLSDRPEEGSEEGSEEGLGTGSRVH